MSKIYTTNIGTGSWQQPAEYTVDANGIMRWTSNNQVPFDDVLARAKGEGAPVDLVASKAAREADAAAFLREYTKRQSRRTPAEIAEHRAELRAAFGPGETVIDIVTGERIKT